MICPECNCSMSLEDVESPMYRPGKFGPEIYIIVECYCGAVIDASIPGIAKYVPLKTYEPTIEVLKPGRKLAIEPINFSNEDLV